MLERRVGIDVILELDPIFYQCTYNVSLTEALVLPILRGQYLNFESHFRALFRCPTR